MKIGRRFNQLSLNEYVFYIDNYKKCEDFNTLGLYRSIIENKKLSLAEKIEVREYAHKIFKKSFDFFQLKDPQIFIEVSTLGEELTKGDDEKLWDEVRKNQQRILADKRIRHRNFGTYSKHTCPYGNCVYQGLMIREGSLLAERNIHFDSDRTKYGRQEKSRKQKLERKQLIHIINRDIDIS